AGDIVHHAGLSELAVDSMEAYVTQAGMAGDIVHHAGLSELAVDSMEAYVTQAVGLSRNLERLQTLRAGMRARVRGSVLMNGEAYARAVEKAFAAAWEEKRK
ncbi:MAG: hypothetical protein HQL53_09600, partial [Magnetococcales bacterium]|nr:hypothetical protein [Magnetococcales bacterium]